LDCATTAIKWAISPTLACNPRIKEKYSCTTWKWNAFQRYINVKAPGLSETHSISTRYRHSNKMGWTFTFGCFEGKALVTWTHGYGFTSVSVSFVVENGNHIACKHVRSLLNSCVPYIVSEFIAMYFVQWEVPFELHIWSFRTHVPLYWQDFFFRHKSTTNNLRNEYYTAPKLGSSFPTTTTTTNTNVLTSPNQPYCGYTF
jgi:hypothetical protein